MMIKAVLICLLVLAAMPKPAKKGAVLHIQPIELALDQFKDIKFTNLNESRALMINVEQGKDNTSFSGFQVTISSQGSADAVCPFRYANNLCVMEHPSKEALVRVKCTSQHCRSSLVFSHRPIVTADDPQSKKKLSVSGEIYRLSKHKFNSILEIYAEREQHKMLASQLTVFCNIHAFPLQQVQELDTNSAIFGLKPINKEIDQYLYIQNRSTRNQILKAIIKENRGELRDGISIVDFIENYGKHSHNNYTYMGELRNNMQVNVRVFSPRDPKDIPFTIIVKGKATEKEELVEIRSLKFQPIDFQGQKFFDFIFAVSKSVHSPFKIIELQLLLGEVQDKSIFFEIGVSDVQAFSVSIFQHIYFASKAKETLHFSVASQVQLQLSDGDKDIQILTNAQQKYFSNLQACSLHKGCSIQLKTQKQCSSCSFKFDLRDQDIHNHIIYYDVKNDTIQGKVDLQEEIYFKYAMNGKAATQIVVNSMNVIIYANFDNYKRCKMPTAACHQYAINQQNPIIVRNQDDQPAELIVGVVGLEKTSFKARFLNQINGLQVRLGQKFSYLMDDEQKQLQIRYILSKEDLQRTGEHLHFNLISPLHSMRITVTNQASKMSSVEGYISFDKASIKGDLFIIKIQKINLYYNEYVHFTLVISTNDVAVRLDSTSTHYEKYGIQAVKKFLMEYEPSDSNAINIYTENMQKERGSMILTIRDSKSTEDDGKSSPILTKKLVRDYEFIDLDASLQQLDICDDVNCQLQITIKSEAKVELQQSITLLKQESVISLDDSIWSVFQINQLSRRSHFYFIPRHQNKSITILFNTDDNHLFVNYMIYNYKNSINPADWPFGHQNTAEAGHISNTQEIDIQGNDPELLACWPTCAILINLNEGFQKDQNIKLDHSVIKSYKILATNSILELPEDTKLQFIMKNQDQRVLFILAKNILKYQKLTFFTYYKFGRGKITASLISNDKEYQLNDGKVFVFNELETSLPVYNIQSVISKENLNIETVMVKISILAETTLLVTLEYSSFIRDVYSLKMDDLQVCSLRRGEETWYEFIPERDFTLKLYRVKGFPLTKIIKCKEEDYIKCLSRDKKYLQLKAKEFQQTQATLKSNLGKEIVTTEESNTTELDVFVQKSIQFSDQGCDKCIYVLWVYCFEGDLEMTINLRTKYSEVQLKEMSVFNERLNPGQRNRYLINMLHDKDTTVSVKILEGAARVDVVDSALTLYNETMDSVDNDFKDFTIDASDEEEEENEEEEETDDANFGLTKKSNNRHVFKHAHVTVQAISEKPVEFLISYSVGATGIYLQDGIVVQKQMAAGATHTLFYRNKNKKERAYLSLSSELLKNDNQNASNTITVNFYYYPDAGNRKVKENFRPELPPNRNQNYLGETISHIYELPSKYQLYEVQVQTSSHQKITASINHQELVYLPLGFEYLIKLHENENLNLVVDRPDSEYLKVRIKKCDVSSPSLKYTNDAREFKKGIFQAQVDIDSGSFKQYIQTKKSSKTIHLQLIGSSDSESLLTISVQSSSREQKFSSMNFKAGNKGVVNYRMTEPNQVEVSFKPATCDGKECSVPFNYYLVVAGSVDKIYGELNCANTFFVPMAQKILESNKAKNEVIQLTNNHFNKKTGEYTYRVKLKEKQEFLGVKGVMQGTREEVLYLPVEIRNIWGQLSRVSFGIVFMASLALALVFTLVIVVSTKLARRGYKPIASSE